MVKPKTRPNISFRLLQQHFDKTLTEASAELGVSVTYLKRICKVYGIKSWPYRKIQSLKALVHFLKEKGAMKGAVPSSKQEIERLNNKLRSLLHSELEEFLVTVKSLEKSSQGKGCVDFLVETNDNQQESKPETQDTLQSVGGFRGILEMGDNRGLPYSRVEPSMGRKKTSIAELAFGSQVRDSRLNKNSSLFSTETYEEASAYYKMLEWNLPALAVHLGVDGIRNLGPAKLVELACDYYYKPTRVQTNDVQWNGQYVKDYMDSLSQRLKELQEEKQQLENAHSFLAKTFRESSLRELRRDNR